MRKRTLAVILSSICIFSCYNSVLAEENTVEYSDEYVAFEYLKEVNCDISYMALSETFVYPCFTKMKNSDENNVSSGIRFFKINEYEQRNKLEDGMWKEHFFSEESNEEYDKKIVSDSDNLETQIIYKDGSGDIGYTKLLGFTENEFAVASCVVNENNWPEETKLCRLIYDTAKVTDNYLNNGRFLDENDTAGIIYRNVIMSEQGENYAIAAIDILEKYLAFEMDANTASVEIENIKNRCKSYSETSDFVYDGSVASELYITSLNIDMGSDDAVTETLQELKKLAHIEE